MFDPLTLVFIGLAIFVIYKLNSVLGTRIEDDKGPEKFSLNKVISIVPINIDEIKSANVINITPKILLEGILKEESPAYKGMVSIIEADKNLNPKEFINGARAAYEMIVISFAKGERQILKSLLSKEVYDNFCSLIEEREIRKEIVETQFVSIDKTEIVDALFRSPFADIKVKFQSKIITATKNINGEVINGSTSTISDVIDVWTFSRQTTSSDPNWQLIATESVH